MSTPAPTTKKPYTSLSYEEFLFLKSQKKKKTEEIVSSGPSVSVPISKPIVSTGSFILSKPVAGPIISYGEYVSRPITGPVVSSGLLSSQPVRGPIISSGAFSSFQPVQGPVISSGEFIVVPGPIVSAGKPALKPEPILSEGEFSPEPKPENVDSQPSILSEETTLNPLSGQEEVSDAGNEAPEPTTEADVSDAPKSPTAAEESSLFDTMDMLDLIEIVHEESVPSTTSRAPSKDKAGSLFDTEIFKPPTTGDLSPRK